MHLVNFGAKGAPAVKYMEILVQVKSLPTFLPYLNGLCIDRTITSYLNKPPNSYPTQVSFHLFT